MGQQQSQETSKFLESFKTQFQFLKTVKDGKFGDGAVYQNKADQQMILLKTYLSKNETDQKNALNQCLTLSQMNHKSLLKLLGYHQNVENQMCGNFTKISIYFEYYENTLEKEISSRQEKHKLFSEQELWLILYEILDGLQYLESQKQLLGDVRPQNLAMTKDGHIKVTDIGSLAGERSAFLLTYLNKEKTYLAPELFPLLEHNQLTNQTPSAVVTLKSDIFSLGITLLECSTLYSMKQLYSFVENTYKMDWNRLDQILQTLQGGGYSHFWFRIIRELLQEKPEDRPTYHDILVDKIIQFFRKSQNLTRIPSQNKISSSQSHQISLQQQQHQQQQPSIQPNQMSFQQQQQQQLQSSIQSNQQQLNQQSVLQQQNINNLNMPSQQEYQQYLYQQQQPILQQQLTSPYQEQQLMQVNKQYSEQLPPQAALNFSGQLPPNFNEQFQLGQYQSRQSYNEQCNQFLHIQLEPLVVQMHTPPPQIFEQNAIYNQPFYYPQTDQFGQIQQNYSYSQFVDCLIFSQLNSGQRQFDQQIQLGQEQIPRNYQAPKYY